LDLIGALDDFGFELGEDFRERPAKVRPLIAASAKSLLKKGCVPNSVASNMSRRRVLDVGGMHDGVTSRPSVSTRMWRFCLDLLARIITMRINPAPFFALFTLWLSIMAAVGLTSVHPAPALHIEFVMDAIQRAVPTPQVKLMDTVLRGGRSSGSLATDTRCSTHT